MKYNSSHHEMLLNYCGAATSKPHERGWLTGLHAIADHIGCSVQTVRNRINRHDIFAIKVNGHWVGNIAWYDETWEYRPASMEQTCDPDYGWEPFGTTEAPERFTPRRTIGGF